MQDKEKCKKIMDVCTVTIVVCSFLFMSIMIILTGHEIVECIKLLTH